MVLKFRQTTYELVNLFVDKLDIMKGATTINSKVLWLMGHPEDLGGTRKGDNPASL